jgi:hypothetical protein
MRCEMKKAGRIVLSLIIVISFCDLLEAQKIKTIDGVKTVINGKKPKPPKATLSKLRLEEEMTIGEGDDPDKSFSEVSVFEVNDNGYIYALDFKDRKVKIFDDSGAYVGSIGKKGQGPGELNMPSGILISQKNELIIEDTLNRRLAFFTLEGEFIKNISLADRLGLVNLMQDSQGYFLGREIGLDGDKMYFEIKKYDAELKPLFTFDKIEFAVPIPGTKINIMDLMSLYQFDGKGNVFYGRNQEYELKVFDAEGNHILSIQKDYNPVKITQEDKDEMLDKIPNVTPGVNIKEMFEFPKYYPPYQFFSLDEQERIFVRTWEKGEVKGEYVFDIFNPEGIFIAQYITKADVRLWKDNKMYSIEENDDGFKVIKRYGVYWE